MVSLRPIVRYRRRVFYQSVLVDFQMRMPIPLGGRGYGMQRPYGAWEALSFLRSWMARTSARHARDLGAATPDLHPLVMELANSRGCFACGVSGDGNHRRSRSGLCRQVLDRVELADPRRLSRYWRSTWDSNPPTYYSLPSSSGSPSKSSMAAEADAAAVCLFAPTNLPSPLLAYLLPCGRGSVAEPLCVGVRVKVNLV